MEIEEAWLLEYRIRPYLRYASREQIGVRLNDIMMNIAYFTEAGKIGTKPPSRIENPWLQKLWDLNHECRLRGIDTVKAFAVTDLPYTKQNLEVARNNMSRISEIRRQGIFCKYGRAEHMRAMLKEGTVRVAPASSFAADGNNVAQKDQELVTTTYIGPFDYDLGIIDPYFRRLRPERGIWEVQHVKPTNFHMYCLGTALDVRMFFDFKCDACVIIHDQNEFERRLVERARDEFPDHEILFDSAKYIDPYFIIQRMPNDSNFVYYVKNFRFMYQREYRLAVIPRNGPVHQIDRVFLQLGNLEDIASLFILNV